MIDLLTLDEAADLLRTSPRTLEFWRYRGKGPRTTKIGRHVMYARADLESWVESQRV